MRSERKKGRALLARFMVLLMIINLLSGINPSAVRADNAADGYYRNGSEKQENGVTISKKVTNYNAADGTYDIELKVKGGTEIVQNNIPLDVVLVMDTSGSMRGSALANAKKAANNFVDKLLPKNKNVNIGIVSFAEKGEIKSNLTNNVTALKNAVNGLKAGGGTYTQQGIEKAAGILNNVSGNHKKVMVVVGDGEPTLANGEHPNFDNGGFYRIYDPATKKEGYEQWYGDASEWLGKGYNSAHRNYLVKLINGGFGNGTKEREGRGHVSWPFNLMDDYFEKATLKAADTIKNNTEIITVGIGLENNNLAKSMMNKLATSGSYLEAGDVAGKLDKILDDLAEKLQKKVSEGVITDNMSQFVDCFTSSIKLSGTVGNAKHEISDKSITVRNINLGEGEELTLSYKVRLKDSWKDGEFHPANGKTTLLPTKNGKEIEFDVPKIRADAGNISITVNKEWKNTPVYMRKNARVQLFSGLNENDQTATNEIRRIDANTENADSKVTFENLPVYKNGAKIVYTVKELDDKGEYVEDNTEFELNGNKYKAKYEATSVANTFNIVNTNCDNEFNVSVEKKWTGTPGKAKFKLIKKGDAVVKELYDLILTGDDKIKSFTKELDRYDENGDLIRYIVREEVPNGYVLAGDNDVVVTFANPVAKFENVNIQENISFTLKKVWVGGRAPSAKFTFTNDKPDQAVEATQSKEIDGEGNEWSKTVTLPRYNKDGSEATYTVTEETIPGFTSELSENKVDKNTKELKATNTLESNKTVDINIEKTWEGNIPEGAKRSVEVEVQKKNENDEWVKVKSYTLTPVTSWKKSDKLPKYNSDGTAAEYRTVETAINGEEIPVTTDISNGYKHRVFNININEGSVKNAFEDVEQPADDNKRNIRVVKTWVNATKEQKKDVKVTLYEIVTDENGNSKLEKVDELPLNSGNDWIGEFKNVERYVKPATPAAPSNPTKPEGQGETSTSPTTGTDNSAVGEQPAVEPTLAPAASNEPIARANKNVNKVKAMAMAPDDPVRYVVIETEIDGKGFGNITPDEETNDYELNGYFVSIESNLDKGGNTVFVFNEPKEQVEPQFAKVIATKVWDSSAQGKEKPVEFTLYREMDNKWVPTEKKVTLTGENDSWVATFDKLPEKDELGDSILYYVFETKIGDTVIQNLPDKFSEDVTYTTDTIDGGKYTVKITVKGNEDSNDIIDNVTITNSFAANPTSGGDDYTGPIIPTPTPDPTPTPIPDPTPDTTPTVDIPDDTTPQGDANINTEEAEEAEENDEDVDDTDDDDILEVDNDDVPQGDAKIEDAIAEDPIDIDGDPTPRGPANLPQTGGTASDFLSLIGMGLIGLGLVVKKRK